MPLFFRYNVSMESQGDGSAVSLSQGDGSGVSFDSILLSDNVEWRVDNLDVSSDNICIFHDMNKEKTLCARV